MGWSLGYLAESCTGTTGEVLPLSCAVAWHFSSYTDSNTRNSGRKEVIVLDLWLGYLVASMLDLSCCFRWTEKQFCSLRFFFSFSLQGHLISYVVMHLNFVTTKRCLNLSFEVIRRTWKPKAVLKTKISLLSLSSQVRCNPEDLPLIPLFLMESVVFELLTASWSSCATLSHFFLCKVLVFSIGYTRTISKT